VLGVAADPKLTTPEALHVVGPAAFGYDLRYERCRCNDAEATWFPAPASTSHLAGTAPMSIM